MIGRNFAKATSNGPNFHNARLAYAFRYFAGGASYDIATTFGMAHSEVFESVWEVVDALYKSPVEMGGIVFPTRT